MSAQFYCPSPSSHQCCPVLNVLVAILAAGESRRMGSPKLCLPWSGTTVLGHLLTQWREAGAEKVVVVHPPDLQAPVVRELDRLGVPASCRAPTLAFERGMMGSVVTAATLALRDPGLTHLVIALGDQPQIHPETYRIVLEACAAHPDHLVQVAHQGKAGHPLALPANLLAELSITPAATLRDFLGLQNTPVLGLTCSDSGVLLDLDTPEDYTRAMQTTGTSTL